MLGFYWEYSLDPDLWQNKGQSTEKKKVCPRPYSLSERNEALVVSFQNPPRTWKLFSFSTLRQGISLIYALSLTSCCIYATCIKGCDIDFIVVGIAESSK